MMTRQELIARHPLAWMVLCISVISIPQWVASIWSLFTSEPLVPFLLKKMGSLPMSSFPSFSPYFITVPLGLAMFFYLVYERRKRPSGLLQTEHTKSITQPLMPASATKDPEEFVSRRPQSFRFREDPMISQMRALFSPLKIEFDGENFSRWIEDKHPALPVLHINRKVYWIVIHNAGNNNVKVTGDGVGVVQETLIAWVEDPGLFHIVRG